MYKKDKNKHRNNVVNEEETDNIKATESGRSSGNGQEPYGNCTALPGSSSKETCNMSHESLTQDVEATSALDMSVGAVIQDYPP